MNADSSQLTQLTQFGERLRHVEETVNEVRGDVKTLMRPKPTNWFLILALGSFFLAISGAITTTLISQNKKDLQIAILELKNSDLARFDKIESRISLIESVIPE